MNKKFFLVIALCGFLSAGLFTGISTGAQLKFTYPMEGTDIYAGQVNFTTNPGGDFLWGYCVEPYTYSYWNTLYNYELIPVSGYYAASGRPNLGLIAADLAWKQYNDNSVSLAEKTNLQNDIWAVYKNYQGYSNYSFTYDKGLLESLFDIAFVANANGMGQDFIVYKPGANNPVPEPASMMLFGTGCVVFGGYLRRKLKK